jgi:N-formylglutamate amidohydrolase
LRTVERKTTVIPSTAVSTWQIDNRALPVLVSIPHAGRDLPDWVAREARVSADVLRRLSDPWSDLIAAPLLAAGARVVKANMMRAVADCNRHESEMDGIDVAVALRSQFAPPGRKARAGLGVVPSRLPGFGPLWRTPVSAGSFARRIKECHRPYHRALTDACDELRCMHGKLLVIDLHSMPSLPRDRTGRAQPSIVIGNRHGRSADSRLAAAMADQAAACGIVAALNAPYPGGFITERYGTPQQDMHAIQIEFDRALYLDPYGLAHADDAIDLGKWLLGAVLRCLPMLGVQDDWPLAAE